MSGVRREGLYMHEHGLSRRSLSVKVMRYELGIRVDVTSRLRGRGKVKVNDECPATCIWYRAMPDIDMYTI